MGDFDDLDFDDLDDLDGVAGDDSDWAVKLDCGPCHTCGRKYPGADRNGGHCTTCHLNFASQSGFDKHLRPGRGRDTGEPFCLTTDELLAKGWTLDEHYVYRMPAPAFWQNTNREETQ